MAFIGMAGVAVINATGGQPFIEAESGVQTNGATIVTTGGATGGQAIQFGQSWTPGFAYVCGTSLCLDGKPFLVHAATAYGAYDNPDAEVALAKEAKLNTLEIVNYSVVHHDLASQTAEDTWLRVDKFIAAAKANNIKVALNFSGYGWSLNQSGIKGTTYNWGTFIQTVANRVNTVTGVKYADEPTILMLQLWGEISAPNYPNDPMRGTTAETTEFFRRTLGQLHDHFPKHVGTTGGFSNLNNENSGIDWRAILSLPENPVCQMEINSWNDRDITTSKFTNYCKDLGKPWSLVAFSSCQGAPHFSADINHQPDDAAMVAHHRDMYLISRGGAPAAYPGMGAHFWNLRDDAAGEDQCSIGHQYPLMLAEIQAWAP